MQRLEPSLTASLSSLENPCSWTDAQRLSKSFLSHNEFVGWPGGRDFCRLTPIRESEATPITP
jgi:hypothetical protein